MSYLVWNTVVQTNAKPREAETNQSAPQDTEDYIFMLFKIFNCILATISQQYTRTSDVTDFQFEMCWKCVTHHFLFAVYRKAYIENRLGHHETEVARI